MNCTRPIYSVLLLCVLTLHIVSHSLILPGHQFNHFQSTMSEQINGTDSLTSDDSYGLSELSIDGDWKPPKHSFIDYSTFLSPTCVLHAYNPYVASLPAYEPYQAQPRVFLEIVVPPDHA